MSITFKSKWETFKIKLVDDKWRYTVYGNNGNERVITDDEAKANILQFLKDDTIEKYGNVYKCMETLSKYSEAYSLYVGYYDKMFPFISETDLREIIDLRSFLEEESYNKIEDKCEKLRDLKKRLEVDILNKDIFKEISDRKKEVNDLYDYREYVEKAEKLAEDIKRYNEEYKIYNNFSRITNDLEEEKKKYLENIRKDENEKQEKFTQSDSLFDDVEEKKKETVKSKHDIGDEDIWEVEEKEKYFSDDEGPSFIENEKTKESKKSTLDDDLSEKEVEQEKDLSDNDEEKVEYIKSERTISDTEDSEQETTIDTNESVEVKKKSDEVNTRIITTPVIVIIGLVIGAALLLLTVYAAVVLIYSIAWERHQQSFDFKRLLINFLKGPYTIYRFIKNYRYLPI